MKVFLIHFFNSTEQQYHSKIDINFLICVARKAIHTQRLFIKTLHQQLVWIWKTKAKQHPKKPLMEKSHGLISSLGVWG